MEYELRGDYPLKREEFNEKMRNAEKSLFSLGLGDASEEVGRINATLFLAKIHFIHEQLGYKPYGMFIGAPDFTFQTSYYKFHEVVPEGGKIIWGDGTYDFIPGEIRFDFCGMLVGAVENNPSLEEILDNLHKMKMEKEKYEVWGERIQSRNFGPGSHFLNIYEVEDHEALGLPRSVAVLHTSSNEMRDPLVHFTREKAEEIQTPFGRSYILQGGDAREYRKRCRYASDFSKEKRKLLFEEIFRSDEIIANHNHNELIGTNEAIIGCNIINEEEVYSITLIDSFPAYLVKGKKNLSPEKIEEIGFTSRITERWMYDRLLNANILPHGGGHKLNEVDSVAKVILYPDAKVIIPICRTKTGTNAYEDMETISRSYRFEGTLERVESLELADHYATLRFKYGIKADL